MEATDLNLLTYVIRIKPHIKICEHTNLDPEGTYYYAIEHEKYKAIVHYGKSIRITKELAFAEIFETGAAAQSVCKTLTMREATLATVHPVSKKIFFEATLKGDR